MSESLYYDECFKMYILIIMHIHPAVIKSVQVFILYLLKIKRDGYVTH